MRLPRSLARVVLAASLAALPLCASAAEPVPGTNLRQLHGFIESIHGNVLTLKLRNGTLENVDIGPAIAKQQTGALPIGHAVVVYGQRDAAGTFHASEVGHTSPTSQFWSPDQ
jgi:hypothetical protein